MSGHPTNLPELIEAIKEAWIRLNSTLDSIDDSAITEAADDNGWTTKDHVVNVIAWERSMLFLLQRRPRHEGLGVSQDLYSTDDVDAFNEAIRAANEDRSWLAVRAELEDNHAAFMSTLSTLTWDDLQLTYSHYLPDEPGEETGEPIVYWLYNDTARHFDEHRGWIEELVATR